MKTMFLWCAQLHMFTYTTHSYDCETGFGAGRVKR